MKKRYQVMIDALLAERRESKNGGWAEVRQEDLDLLEKLLNQLIKDKFEGDAENCPPLEIRIVDRNMFEHSHYRDLPYHHKTTTAEGFDTVFELALFNLRCATEAVTRLMDIRRFQRDTEKRKAEKKKEVATRK